MHSTCFCNTCGYILKKEKEKEKTLQNQSLLHRK